MFQIPISHSNMQSQLSDCTRCTHLKLKIFWGEDPQTPQNLVFKVHRILHTKFTLPPPPQNHFVPPWRIFYTVCNEQFAVRPAHVQSVCTRRGNPKRTRLRACNSNPLHIYMYVNRSGGLCAHVNRSGGLRAHVIMLGGLHAYLPEERSKTR